MSQTSDNIVKKCEVVVEACEGLDNNQNNTSNTLKSVRKKIRNFTIRRKAQENFQSESSEDQKDMNQDKSSEESSGKSKITLKKIFRKSSFKKFISNIQHFTNFTTSNAKNDRVPPINSYVWPPDSTPGVIGLRNHGNTCFMNSVLQCLSHTDILAEYFVLDQYKADLRKRNKINSRKFGTKGELTEQLAQVLKALWTCKDASEYSTNFKEVVERYGSQFRSSTQHDAQEFLFWLLDKVHEDLNTATKRKYKSIKNNYGRSDEVIAAETLANYMRCNNSFVQAVFRAQFRSSLTCPRCHKQSNTFDPFHCISVQLPQLSLQPVNVNVLYDTKTPRQVRMSIGVPQGSSILSLREKLHLETNIDEKRLVLTEVTETGFGRLFCDSHPSSTIEKSDTVLCIELPDKVEDSQVALCIMNVKVTEKETAKFGSVFCMKINRDVSFSEFQKALLKQMSSILKSEVFSYSTPICEMFKIHFQEPSADPRTYLESKFEHPLLTEMIDLALSVQPSDSGPLHIKLSLEWSEPEKYFIDMEDHFVEHESLTEQKDKATENNVLSLEQCLDHYTKAETLSAEDAWRCPQCQKYLPVVKTLGLWSLPDILVIHFKRFRQQQFKGSHASKLTTMVDFPLTGFDLSSWHLANGSNGTSSVDSTLSRKSKSAKIGAALTKTNLHEDHRYDLYAVCYHQGDTLETGHYTAACKNPYDQQWYKFDDQRVSLIKNEDVTEKIINNEAYMLFYQRRKVSESSDSSGASTSSTEHWVSKIAPVVATKSATKVTNDVTVDKKEKEKEEDEITKPEVEREETKKKAEEVPLTNEITSVLNIEDIQAIDGDDIPEIVSEPTSIEANVNEQLDETSSEEENSVIKLDNKVTVHVEVLSSSSTSPTPEIEISPEHENNKQANEAARTDPRRSEESDKIEELMSQQAINNLLWNDANNNNNNRHSDVGAITISDLLSMDRIEEISSSSLPKNYMLHECEPIRMRGVSSCSKDTLLYIDQQGLLEDDSLLENRAHWISPVTPHKSVMITVSPKN